MDLRELIDTLIAGPGDTHYAEGWSVEFLDPEGLDRDVSITVHPDDKYIEIELGGE